MIKMSINLGKIKFFLNEFENTESRTQGYGVRRENVDHCAVVLVNNCLRVLDMTYVMANVGIRTSLLHEDCMLLTTSIHRRLSRDAHDRRLPTVSVTFDLLFKRR